MSRRAPSRIRTLEECDDATASQPDVAMRGDHTTTNNNNTNDRSYSAGGLDPLRHERRGRDHGAPHDHHHAATTTPNPTTTTPADYLNHDAGLLNPVHEQEIEFQEMLNDVYEMKRLAAQGEDERAEEERAAAERASEQYALEQQLLEIQKHHERMANRRRIRQMTAEQRQSEARALLATIQERHDQERQLESRSTTGSRAASRRDDVGDSPPRQYQSTTQDDVALQHEYYQHQDNNLQNHPSRAEEGRLGRDDQLSLPSSLPRIIPVHHHQSQNDNYGENADDLNSINSVVPQSDLTTPSRYWWASPTLPSSPPANRHRTVDQEQSIRGEVSANHHTVRAIAVEENSVDRRNTTPQPWFIRYYVLIVVILSILLLTIICTALAMVIRRNNSNNSGNSNDNNSGSTIPSPTNIPITIFKGFDSTTELYAAVDDYLLINNDNGGDLNAAQSSQVTITYGSPIGIWNVSTITDFSSVFSASRNPLAASFDQDLDQWDVSSAISMEWMFAGATAFNGDVSTWDVSSATTMRGMFFDATSFQRNISGWEVKYVTDTSFMFQNAATFNRDLSPWDVSRVEKMNNMFQFAISFNQDLSVWDVSKVQDASFMFFGASQFNQSLCEWGNLLPMSCEVTYMFQQTACPMALDDPQLIVTSSSGTPGPFCEDCF